VGIWLRWLTGHTDDYVYKNKKLRYIGQPDEDDDPQYVAGQAAGMSFGVFGLVGVLLIELIAQTTATIGSVPVKAVGIIAVVAIATVAVSAMQASAKIEFKGL